MDSKQAVGSLQEILRRNQELEEENGKLLRGLNDFGRQLREIGLVVERLATVARPSGPHEIFSQNVNFLDLTVRARNCLKKAGVETIGHLVTLGEADLRSYRFFSDQCFDEVKSRLSELGLRLEMTDQDIANWVPPSP